MMRKPTKELCPACYYRDRHYVKMIECVSWAVSHRVVGFEVAAGVHH